MIPGDDGIETIPVTLEAGKIVGGGQALAHHDGKTWFVDGALPGEVVEVTIRNRRAGIVEASTVRVLRGHHSARDSHPCPHAAGCGGCDWPHVDPSHGAAMKVEAAAEAVRNISGLATRLRSAPIRRSPLAYRLRARLHWDPDTRTIGFYDAKSWRVSPIGSCRLISPRLAGALPHLGRILEARCPTFVDVEWIEDLLGDHAVAALRPARNQTSRLDPRWLPDPDTAGGLVEGFHLLERSGRPTTGWGRSSVSMALPVTISVPIGSFFQVNRHLAGWLFDRVAQLTGPRSVPTWDLHAGVGFLAAAAQHAAGRELHLVEPSHVSAEAARRNLPSAVVAAGQTAEGYLQQAGPLPEQALVMVDPPRSGMTPELRQRLADWGPARILMLACDPATWGRDTQHLVDHGFTLTHLEMLDLFPSTHHVEILAVLEKP